MDAVTVPQIVHDGIIAVRDSGKTNMLSIKGAIRVAKRMGLIETVKWIRLNQKLYASGVFYGFRHDE